MAPFALAVCLSLAAPLQIPPSNDFAPFVGRWDLTIQTRSGPRPAWLEIERSGNFVVGRFVGAFGSVRPVEGLRFDKNTIRFDVPRQWEREAIVFEGKLNGDALSGEVKSEPRLAGSVKGVRAPLLRRETAPKWGPVQRLFDGNSLAGWKTDRPGTNWTVRDGLLVNLEGGVNLVSERTFQDFRLTVEFRYPKGSNSGIYLRGRYEVQIEDQFGLEPNRHGPGSIYGFFVPSENASKKPGEWQRYEIELVGRTVTLVYNGVRVLDRQSIPGITGGALDSDEGSPGPIYIQGDHGPIEFRKVELREAT